MIIDDEKEKKLMRENTLKIGAVIKEVMQDRGISRAALLRKTSLSEPTIRKALHGYPIKADSLREIASALSVSSGALMMGKREDLVQPVPTPIDQQISPIEEAMEDLDEEMRNAIIGLIIELGKQSNELREQKRANRDMSVRLAAAMCELRKFSSDE